MSTNTPQEQGPWQPTDDQLNFEVNGSWDLISSELEDLQQSLGCPDVYIVGLLEAIAQRFQR